ncbi:hypothetical protein AMECASPLE_005938, partial [Ameca splendens]
IWSLSFMDCMHYLKETSASRQCETSGSSQTWNCSGKLWCLESECLLNYTRTTSRPLMNMMSRPFFTRRSPHTSRTWSSLTRATRAGGALCCPMPLHSSPCATCWTKARTSTRSSCSIGDTSASASS